MTSLPRLAPASLDRRRIALWLARHEERPLRFLAATAGTGKTTAVTLYLASAQGRSAYVALRRDESLDAFRGRLARELAIEYVPASFEALLAALATRAPCRIAVDDLDKGTSETREELEELAAAAPQDVSFIFCARSRVAIDAGRFLGRGIGALLDGPALAFDADDVTQLAEMTGVPAAAPDAAHLVEETEGWPMVVSWALRDAAEAGLGAGSAYEHWCKSEGRHFRDFIEDEFRSAGGYFRDAFRLALRETGGPDEHRRLAELEEHGLFVYFSNGTYHPYRVARRFDLEPASPAEAESPASHQMVVRMFGRFEAEIGGRRIDWIRRREAQLFQYLLLKPDGAASRAELLATFWPGSELHAATQSLRTASSNIRKAIAAVAGYANVDRYFRSSGNISVLLDNTVIDVRRFTTHCADGDAAWGARRGPEAFAHYRAAEQIYKGELLSGEYPEPWYAPRAQTYRALFHDLLERIADYHLETGHPRQAREYQNRIRELRARAIVAE